MYPHHCQTHPENQYKRQQAKGRADEAVRESGLRYVILRPGRLTNEPPEGRVALAKHVARGSVSRADVAAVLVACLDGDRVDGRTLELVGGPTPIEEAIAAL